MPFFLGSPFLGSHMKLVRHLDWLSVTFPVSHRDDVMGFLRAYLGDWKLRDYGLATYRVSAVCELGGVCAWSEGRSEAYLALPASCLEKIPREQHLFVCATLRSDFGAKSTRLDVATDDVERAVPLELVHAAAEAYNFLGFRLTDSHRPKECGVLVGDSRTFGRVGKNGSGKYLIVYDKGLESGGLEDFIRWEARFYKDVAGVVFENLCDSDSMEEFDRKLGRAWGGVIDFRVRTDDAHSERWARVDWWQRVLDETGRVVYRLERSTPPLQRFCEHVGRTVLNGLALARIVAQSEGVDFWQVLNQALDERENVIDWRRASARELGVDLTAAWLEPKSAEAS